MTCKYNGVHVVDIADPAKPREVAFIGSKEGSYAGEGVQALPLSTRYFKGNAREYVAAGDRDYGVYIFRYTGGG